MTPLLYHGPEARTRAIQTAEELGRPLGEPIGDAGLKVDDSRRVVEIAQNPGVGDRPPSLVIGPLDQGTVEAMDALLKTLEDLTESPLRIVLWANYISGVRGTIRSRTHAVWCPPGPTYLDPLSYLASEAEALCEGVLTKDPVRILGALEDREKDWAELLQATCKIFAENADNPDVIRTWVEIRQVLDGRGSLVTAIDAVLPREV